MVILFFESTLTGTFPHYQNSPAQGTQLPLITDIPFPILEQLLRPKIQTGFRLPSAAWMLMPETTVHKDNLAQPRKDHVRNSGKFARMKAVSKSHAVYQTADDHLWTGICALDARHPLASLLFGEIIHRIG